MKDMDGAFLSVEEVAALLKVHRNTVYRWCQEGRIPALRFGKHWRIPRAALQEARGGEQWAANRGAALTRHLCLAGDHVLAMAPSHGAVYDLEARFLAEGLGQNARLFKACWWQHPDDARRELAARGLEVEALEREGRLALANLQAICDRQGPLAAAQVWVEEARRAQRQGYDRLWGCGSPYVAPAQKMHARLRSFEAALERELAGLPVVGMCSYVMDGQVPDFFAKLAQLMASHGALLAYGGSESLVFARVEGGD